MMIKGVSPVVASHIGVSSIMIEINCDLYINVSGLQSFVTKNEQISDSRYFVFLFWLLICEYGFKNYEKFVQAGV
jgi:hypothetical protein